ncbi:chorismate mutase/prephenate dehydratase [Candidatus Omnitrophus magneticus]|uniref:Bifunctional chorismate mutase/prephenate dehydratase n=1 Tax=Candidatus Omnitrophus magneticus TaxID=1609969 RepID=A0A0F0CRG1_9BACT|nr:chorismate mutase/prephenate dehydratase [Candidatus Omnitrophus magneticus]
MNKKGLGDLRLNINDIDKRIIGLISERGLISKEIGEIKKEKGQPVYSPDRESQVYKNIEKMNHGPLSNNSIKAIYSEIMSACLSLEQPLVVAYLGPECTFTHQVAIRKFGTSVKYLSCNSITEVFVEVEKGNANYGVVPIENSIEGAVTHTMDMFVSSPVVICSEIFHPIKHNLLSKIENFKDIKKIYSNPQVFGQCRIWLEQNLPWAKLIDSSSTAKASESASREKFSASIASELAARKYGLKILAKSIEDFSGNITRFLVIGKKISEPSQNDKTSILFSVKDKPGILHDMLSPFKERGINLTKIESRPSKAMMWKYYFFIDLVGHVHEKEVESAIKELETKCDFLKILGSYPRGE